MSHLDPSLPDCPLWGDFATLVRRGRGFFPTARDFSDGEQTQGQTAPFGPALHWVVSTTVYWSAGPISEAVSTDADMARGLGRSRISRGMCFLPGGPSFAEPPRHGCFAGPKTREEKANPRD